MTADPATFGDEVFGARVFGRAPETGTFPDELYPATLVVSETARTITVSETARTVAVSETVRSVAFDD